MNKKDKPVDISRFRRLYPFSSNFLKILGFKYHYIDEGMGEPIVMVHGNPTWSFYFRELIKGLSPRYRVIAPDHIGCGLSDKPKATQYDYRLLSRVDDLETLLGSLNLKRQITLVLHDWGGVIGMAYAIRHPDKIGRIVLMNTATFPPLFGKKLPLRLRMARNMGLFSKFAVLRLNLFVRGAIYMAPHKRLARDVRAGLKAPYNCPAHRIAVLKFVQDIPTADADPSYAAVKLVDENLNLFSNSPLLICWGMHDFVFDADYLGEFKRRFPHSEIHTFSDAGHYVLEDVPDKILFHVKSFLKRHPVS